MTTSESGHFQQMSQSAWRQLHQAIIKLSPRHFPEADSEQLTILLIQQLSHNLQAQNLAEFWNHCQEYGEAVDRIANELSRLPPTLEFSFAERAKGNRLPANCFSPGAYVRWKPLPEDADETDTGTIVGSFYAPSQHGWNWKYLVLLDRSSYSRQFCIADTAWESDLEGWQKTQCH
jgi:hypothetical protein